MKRIAYRTLCIAPAIICTVLLLFSKQCIAPVTVWRGYNILLVDAEAELGPVLDSLAFIPHVSHGNTHVYVNVFSGVEKVSLSAVGTRLDEDDPRYDPYISSLPKYFSAGFDADTWHVVYIKSERSQLRLRLSLHRRLKPLGIEYRLPEGRPGWFFAGPVAACCALFLLARGRRREWEMLLLSLPLAVVAAKASGLGLAAALLIIPGWHLLAAAFQDTLEGYLYSRKFTPAGSATTRGAALFCLGIACAFVLSVFHVDPGKFRFSILMVVVGLVVSLAAYAALRLYGTAERCHRLFHGMSVLEGTVFEARRNFAAFRKVYATLLLVVFVFSPCLVVLSRIDPDLAVAKPSGTAGRPENRLPDIADYVTHRAYQDSLPYRREWAYPEQDEEVTINSFTDENGKIVAGKSRVLLFDSKWFGEVMGDAASDGIGGMLLGQGGDVNVQYRVARNRGVAGAVKPIATAALIIVPLAYLLPSLTSYCIYGMKNLSLRRKRQTA